ncbi:MAG TPA: HPF/RaiA family ribosome-associated protein [Nitrospira sp.]|nr:HPF/RaiA family ribosome-associated protein [Nitrospira sp.]
MKILVNSDNTIAVDASLTRFVEGKVNRVLGRFAKKLTRVEVHLSDVDKRKTGQADKRCLIEVRPAGTRPLTASADATKMASSVGLAVGKVQRLLTTFFGRRGRPAATVSGSVSTATKTTIRARKKTAVKKILAKKRSKLRPGGPKKKRIYQARRKSWPGR